MSDSNNVIDLNESVNRAMKRLIHTMALALAALEDTTTTPIQRIELARHFLTTVVPSNCNENSNPNSRGV